MNDFLEPLWKALAARESSAQLQSLGQEIAEKLQAEISELIRQRRILEEILGWRTFKATEAMLEVGASDSFRDVVRATVKEFVANGRSRVTVYSIEKRLRDRGIPNGRKNSKNSRIAIGNIIARLPGWKRVGVGVYEFQEPGR